MEKYLSSLLYYEGQADKLLNDLQVTITRLSLLLTEKSDMVDLLSHDLRSPMARILSLSNLIKTDTEGQKDIYADHITAECSSMLRMLENILLMIKGGGAGFGLHSINLRALAADTVRFFELPLTEKGLQAHVDIEEDIYVNVQHDLFMYALRNIVGNAIKFSFEGQQITISAQQDERYVYLYIKDEGMGFRPEDAHRIFERFTGAGKIGTRGEASTGLGLHLGKKTIERHGGRLTAQSEGANKGATFTISLPKLVIKKQQGKIIELPAQDAGLANIS